MNEIAQIERDLKRDDNLTHLIEKIISTWVLRKSESATLDVLIKALDEVGLEILAETLRTEFKIPKAGADQHDTVDAPSGSGDTQPENDGGCKGKHKKRQTLPDLWKCKRRNFLDVEVVKPETSTNFQVHLFF